MAAAWPSDADLAAWLGLAAGDDTERVAQANAAGQAAAVHAGHTADASSLDGEQWQAVLVLGAWWYMGRNRPEGLDSLNPVAFPYSRRTALGILMRSLFPVA